MDSDDFVAALYLCLREPWRNFDPIGIWRVAEEIGQQRRSVRQAR